MFSRKAVLVILVLCCSVASAEPETVAAKVAAIRSSNAMTQALIALADRCSKHECEVEGVLNENAIAREVDAIFQNANDSRVLFQVAVMSYAIAYPQTAGMQRVDYVFDAAWRHAIRKLRLMHSLEALETLQSLNDLLKLDGGDSLQLDEAIDEVRRRVSISKH